jgi:dihydroorotase
MFDLVIEGRILQDGSPAEVFLCINDGVIEVIRRSTPGKGEMGEHHRYGSHLILPGAVDTHVHFRDPGLTKKEDFLSGSISAAFGGVTTVMDMPNTRPPTIDQRSLVEKDRIASRSSVVDYGLHLGILNSTDVMAVDALLGGNGGIAPPAGLKAFLGESTGSLVLSPIEILSKWAHVLRLTGATLSIHAEDGSLFNDIENKEEVKDVLMSHHISRPPEAEAAAITKAVRALGNDIGHAHFLHVSTKVGLEAVKGSGATLEVTPHHLLLDVKWGEKNLDDQARAKVNPPVRTPEDRAALWEGISDGSVSTIGSDHAPHLLEEKANGLLSPSGMPGVETMVPLILHQVKQRKLTLERSVQLLSSNPSQRMGLEKKGEIKVGNHADLIVVNLAEEKKIRGDDLHSKCGWTAYEGMIGIFPQIVYGRGALIIEDESLCIKSGIGLNIRD